MSVNRKKQIRLLCHAAIIASLYIVFTYLTAMLGLASGAIQLRLSEALCILVAFTPAAVPGLTLGCLISNLITGCLPTDVLFGALATLLGAIGGRLLRKNPYLVPLPTVLANTLIVPFVLVFAYRVEQGLPFLFLSVGIGELLSAYLLGILLYSPIKKNQARLLGNIE
jgi:uncharacterized membrane protein